jgi:hypothetical protein
VPPAVSADYEAVGQSSPAPFLSGMLSPSTPFTRLEGVEGESMPDLPRDDRAALEPFGGNAVGDAFDYSSCGTPKHGPRCRPTYPDTPRRPFV